MKIVLSFSMKTTILTFLALLLFTIGLRAQGLEDAVFNSQTYYEGTGRSMGMGNATGALGGDITAMCINPAGLGLYRTQEFTFSTGLQHDLVHSSYYGTGYTAGKTRVSIPNTGFVMTMPCSNYKPLRYMQLAFGLTRTNDFNYHSHAYGLNPNSSMVDAYLQTANGIDELFDPNTDVGDYLSDNYAYDLHPAWQTYLIDRFQDSLGYYFSSPIPQGNVYQENTVKSKGRSEEWTIALSLNFYDKLFFGSSLGLAHIKRISTRQYTETPGDASVNSFQQWSHIEELGDTAWGANLKFGVICFPASWLRIGAAWHSRTTYFFGENWSTETSATLKDDHGEEEYYKYFSPTLYQSYEFRAPGTIVGSMAFFIGKHGMISTDVEYRDYRDSWFSSDSYSFNDANYDIKYTLKPSLNLRVGTEWRTRQFFVRGGAAYYGSPFGFGEHYGSMKKLALGIGYATQGDSFWDFAYELSEATTGYTPYQYYEDGENVVQDVVQRLWRNKFVITLKVKME